MKFSNSRLLVFDDDVETARLVEDIAGGLGFAVGAVRCSPDFSAAFDRLQPTHVLLDFGTQERDDFRVFREIGTLRGNPTMIVACDFEGQMGSFVNTDLWLRNAQVSLLIKPFRLAELRAVLTDG